MKPCIIILLTLLSLTSRGQDLGTPVVAWPESLQEVYGKYKYEPISDRRFKHEDVLVALLVKKNLFEINEVAKSNEGRSINLVSAGEGEIDVLLWSQMHGNETTATMAMLDIFNWLSATEDGYDSYRNIILSKLKLHFVPMLNPDGAQRFTRRNTQGIDINRDALRQQTPEGRVLKNLRDSLDADWGFNLHDQGRSTTAASKPATLSFLAPAYDVERNVNEKREDAMQLIASMNNLIQKVVPGQVGRYWDDFEPRAFGDNIQKWGTRTILIESGGEYHDREKQLIREYNFLALIHAMHSIATKSYEDFSESDYLSIPANSRGMSDVILRNVMLSGELGTHLTDIAINFTEVQDETYARYYLKASIEDLGDLSTSNGYIVYDLEGLRVEEGQQYSKAIVTLSDLTDDQLNALLKEGYTDYVVKKPNFFDQNKFIKIVRSGNDNQVQLGNNPSLLFYEGDQLRYLLINGLLIDSKWTTEEIRAAKKRL
jgi:hypothetical protein